MPTPSQTIPASGWKIRAPLPHERMACWMLLTQVDPGAQDLQLLVALDESGERIIGAAALACDTRPPDLERWYVDIHVIPPYRLKGVAAALLTRLIAMADRHGIPALDTWGWSEEGSPAANAWEKLGFSVAQQKYEFFGTVQSIIDGTKALHELSVQRGRIPASARLIPLKDADKLAVARLHARHLGGTVERLLPMLDEASVDPFNGPLSPVLMLEDRVAGCVLTRVYPDEKLSSCDAVIVDHGIRGGWASAWLRYEAALWALAAGLVTVRFHALAHHKDTKHASRRLGSTLTKTFLSFRRVLASDPGPGGATAGRA
jgi:GNAT superfamily N-acetyltransferase